MLTYLTASGSSGSLAAAVMASSGAVVDVFVPASAMTDLLLGRELINALRGAQDVLHVSKFVALCERLMHIGRAAAECMHARLTESSAQSLGKQTGACGERAARSPSKGQGYRAHVLGADCLPVQQRACSSCLCCVLERRGTCGHPDECDDAMASESKRERAHVTYMANHAQHRATTKLRVGHLGLQGCGAQAMHAGSACHQRNEA